MSSIPLEAIPEESVEVSSSGPVSSLLRWRWSSTPAIVGTAVALLTNVYGRVKESHGLCKKGLEATEGRVLNIGSVLVRVVDVVALRADVRVASLLAEAKSRGTQLKHFEESVMSTWHRRGQFGEEAVECLTGTRGVQAGLFAAHSMVQVVENWTTSQTRFLRSLRLWISRTLRSELPRDFEDTRKIASPRKRVKLMHRLWHWFSSSTLSLETKTTGTEEYSSDEPDNSNDLLDDFESTYGSDDEPEKLIESSSLSESGNESEETPPSILDKTWKLTKLD